MDYLVYSNLILFFSTVLGILPIFFLKQMHERTRALIEGLCAGSMLGAAWIALLTPSFDLVPDEISKKIFLIVSIILGYFFLEALHRFLPHEHKEKGVEGPASSVRRSWLITLAILIHNLPEGFSVGVGGTDANSLNSLMLATISAQNFPEGLIVALALRASGVGLGSILTLLVLTAGVEVAASLIGAWTFHLLSDLLPFGLGFAAGAMLFVVCREMIPECQKNYEARASVGICAGICSVILIKFFLP